MRKDGLSPATFHPASFITLPFLVLVLFLRIVGTLSNFPWLGRPRNAGNSAELSVRPARESEMAGGARLLATDSSGAVDDLYARDLVRLARLHREALGGMHVAERGGRLHGVVLPVVSPGRTMLLFVPLHINGAFEEHASRQLIEMVCGKAASSGVQLAQVLVDVHGERTRSLLLGCGFRQLAELLYMHLSVHREVRAPILPDGCGWVTYGPESHDLFARTILASYQQSLDCPALNGLRDIGDIIAGHRATGEFDPSLWFALRRGHEGAAVVLLSRVPRANMVELIYLGVAPEHRGRGMADLLLRQALWVTSASGYARLSLAVDASNVPALKLYWRHGLQAAGRKMALLRDLRKVMVEVWPVLKGAEGRGAVAEGADAT